MGTNPPKPRYARVPLAPPKSRRLRRPYPGRRALWGHSIACVPWQGGRLPHPAAAGTAPAGGEATPYSN